MANSAWMEEARQFMEEHLVFAGGLTVIELWLQLEQRLGALATSKAKLSFKKRPEEVEWFYKNGCKFQKVPELAKRRTLGPRIIDWYGVHNPSWRGQWPFQKDPQRAQPEDWDALAVGGNCGVVMLLVCVTWWAMGVETVEERQFVTDLLDDMAWVFKLMLENLGANKTQPKAKPRMKTVTAPKATALVVNRKTAVAKTKTVGESTTTTAVKRRARVVGIGRRYASNVPCSQNGN